MPHRLTNLKISEISSVDKGAGKGVRVLLRKRDNTERNIMQNFDPVTLAEQMVAKVEANEWSEYRLGLFEVELAKRMFPTAAAPLVKFENTAPWKIIHASRSVQSLDQRATLMKREGYIGKEVEEPFNRRSVSIHREQSKPNNDDGNGDSNGDSDLNDVGQQIKHLQTKFGLSYDEAASRVHRAEQVSKGWNY